MIAVKFDISDTLLRRARSVAESEGMTLDQFIAVAVSGQLARWETVRFIEDCLKRKGWEDLSQIPVKSIDVEPAEEDRLD